MGLLTSLLSLRSNPKVARLPPYLSLLCIVVCVAWLFLLPLDEYSRRTYVSENAILPGQVHTYFGGSEHDVFRAYRHEVAALTQQPAESVYAGLEDLFKQQGLKVARQPYSYNVAGKRVAGENVYAMLQGPRADATEAIVLMAAWKNMDDVLNQSGVALVLTLARYFNRWSLWSKDIFFVITPDSTAGPQAWVDAYHSEHDPRTVHDLPIRGGALQGAIALDYPAGPNGHRFDKIHIVYDGINGQLPNLDLINTVTVIGTDYMAIGTTIQRMWKHDDSYEERLKTMLYGMLIQGLGHGSGPHSCFIPYHVDAITLQTVGDGWHDEMTLGRLVESTFRSLNNLLEHLHQSFFFYLLMHARRFVSIGTYLPSAMLVAVNFTIMSIALWVQSGRPAAAADNSPNQTTAESPKKDEQEDVSILEHRGKVTVVPKKLLATAERSLLFPLSFVLGAHLLGITPLYLIHGASPDSMNATFLKTAFATQITPYLAATFLANNNLMTPQARTLIPCISLLLLGIALSTLSTLNFSLGLLVGLACTPLSMTQAPLLLPAASKSKSSTLATIRTIVSLLLLHLVHPTTIVYLASFFLTSAPAGDVKDVLLLASEAWTVQGTYTALVVWLVWWPAWFVGTAVVSSALFEYGSAVAAGQNGDKKEVGVNREGIEGDVASSKAEARVSDENKRIYVKSVPERAGERGGARGMWNG